MKYIKENDPHHADLTFTGHTVAVLREIKQLIDAEKRREGLFNSRNKYSGKFLAFFCSLFFLLCVDLTVSHAQLSTIWTQVVNPGTSVSDLTDRAFAITTDASGVYIAGTDRGTVPSSGVKWRIEKRDKASGALMAAFDGDGVIQENCAASDDVIHGIAADATGLYLVGYNQNTVSSSSEWRIEKRDLTTGALIGGFGTGGIITEDISAAGQTDRARAIAVDASGIYIAGFDGTPGSGLTQCRIEKRDLTSGALIAGFGTGGIVTNHPSAFGSDRAFAITVDASGVYIAGWTDVTPGSPVLQDAAWLMEKRNLTTGALIWSQVYNPGVSDVFQSYNEVAYSIKANASGVYVAGYDNYITNAYHLQKRDLNTGALIAAFGTAGDVESFGTTYSTTFPTDGEEVCAIDIHMTEVYITGKKGTVIWRTEQRDATTGALICFVESDPSGDIDRAAAIAVDGTGIYVAGHDRIPGNNQWRIEKYNGVSPCAVLPVDLISFTGKCDNQEVVLNWQTASEQNSNFFAIERSADGKIFEEIGQVQGAGNSSTIRKYEFVAPLSFGEGQGVRYYRLKQTDYDGKYEYFGSVSVGCNAEQQIIILPSISSNGYFTVAGMDNADEITVYNLLGEKIFFAKDQPLPYIIDVSLNSEGIYFVDVKSFDKIKNRKVMIRR